MLRYPQEYLDDVMVRFAYNSNAIEGNTLSLGETRAVILNQTVTTTGILNMATWDEVKKNLTSISSDEMTAIESLAYLHAQRIKQGISQMELARRIGMKQPQLAKIENLTSIPSLETLDRYARGLGLQAVVTFKKSEAKRS